MANRLKDIFSDEMFSVDGKINFQNTEAYRKFMEALKAVWEEGRTVTLDDGVSIETAIRNGESVYPLEKQEHVTELTVSPSKEQISLELDTEFGRRVLTFERYYTNNAVMLQTEEDSIVYIKLTMGKSDRRFKFTYHVQPEKANSVREVWESYSAMLAFLERFFRHDEDGGLATLDEGEADAIGNIEAFFRKACLLYKKLDYVEQEFGLIFKPAELTQDEESQMDLEELYLGIKEGKAIRLNAKLTETEATGIVVKRQDKKMKIGSILDITFISNVEYSLWGHKVGLYSANLLSNAIVKKIIKGKNGEMRILYGNEDSRPMFISYRAFKTEEEAQEEMKKIMECKDIYADALTVHEYVKNL